MRRAIQSAAALLLLAGLTGCGAVRPSKYYTLNLPSDSSPAVNPFPVSLLVGHITAPHLFRDDRIVYRKGKEELGTYAYQRWAEPPTDMIEDMLVRQLRGLGRFRSVERLASNARGDYILHGHLSRLEEADNHGIEASFALELELFYPKTGTTVWNQLYSHDEPVSGKTVADVVQALNRNVQRGLAELAASLDQYFTSNPPK